MTPEAVPTTKPARPGLAAPVALGALAGAAGLICVSLGLTLGYFHFSGSTPPARLLQILWPAWFARHALVGGALGAVTLAGVALSRSESRMAAGRLYIVAGSTAALLLLAQVGYITFDIANRGGSVRVAGPSNLPVMVRFAVMSLVFNVSLQWSLLLIGFGLWLRRPQRAIR